MTGINTEDSVATSLCCRHMTFFQIQSTLNQNYTFPICKYMAFRQGPEGVSVGSVQASTYTSGNKGTDCTTTAHGGLQQVVQTELLYMSVVSAAVRVRVRSGAYQGLQLEESAYHDILYPQQCTHKQSPTPVTSTTHIHTPTP